MGDEIYVWFLKTGFFHCGQLYYSVFGVFFFCIELPANDIRGEEQTSTRRRAALARVDIAQFTL